MKGSRAARLLAAPAVLALAAATAMAAAGGAAADWALNATAIEACSCPLVCQCYFGHSRPAGHHAHHGDGVEHYCRANIAHRVNRGHYGTVRLDGVKFWEAGDLGGDFTQGFDWMVLHFDPAVTSEQRAAIEEIYNRHMKPLPYRSYRVGEDAPIEWQADRDGATARLAGGRMAEVVLRRLPGLTDEPVVIRNLKYFNAARHDGFVLMPNEVEAYRVGPQAFEYRGTNGFMITYEITSNDVAAGTAGR